MRKTSELAASLAVLVFDYLALVSAFVLAYIVRVKIDARPVANPIHALAFFKLALLALPFWIIIFALAGLYNLSNLRGRLNELGKIIIAVSGGTMFLILLDFFSTSPFFPSKAIPIYGLFFSLILVIGGRQIVRLIQRWLFRYGIGMHQVVIIGSGVIAQRVAADLASPRTGYRVIGIIDTAAGAARRMNVSKVFKRLDDLVGTFGSQAIDEFIQADSALGPEAVLEIVSYANTHHMGYRFVPNQFGLFATHSTVTMMAGMPMIEIKHTPLEGWGRIVKRLFDIIGAALGLIVLSPLLALISIGIKLTDPGPVLYRQQRLTRAKQVINILKFRTMKVEYCTGPDYHDRTNTQVFKAMNRMDLNAEFRKENKLAEDPRVSRLGRWLRRASLDELPQLINVLKGDLSLVGPRPMLADEVERYGDHLHAVLALRCGVTGLWQTSGRTDVGFDGRVKMDLYYVENWSLWMDIRILLKTIYSIIQGRGAY